MQHLHSQAVVTSRATCTAWRGQVHIWSRLAGRRMLITSGIQLPGLGDGAIVPSSLPMGNRLAIQSQEVF